jgi:hypothetical protein
MPRTKDSKNKSPKKSPSYGHEVKRPRKEKKGLAGSLKDKVEGILK